MNRKEKRQQLKELNKVPDVRRTHSMCQLNRQNDDIVIKKERKNYKKEENRKNTI